MPFTGFFTESTVVKILENLAKICDMRGIEKIKRVDIASRDAGAELGAAAAWAYPDSPPLFWSSWKFRHKSNR